MTKLLKQAFQKATQELDEVEQNLLATFLLQQNLHSFLNENIRLMSEYNTAVQQAIEESTHHTTLNQYKSIDEFFTQLKS